VSADFDSVRTDPSRSPSPSFDSAPHKKRSKAKSVSRKARGVIGKVRAFQRIAAAKMAPTIKIDTSVQATKRGLPENDDAGLDILGADLDNPKLEAGNTEDVPPFLCQSVSGE
jgi:protein-tyrosine phosphatase